MKRLNRTTIIILVILTVILLFTLKLISPLYGIIVAFIWRITLPFLLAIIISYLLYPILKKLTDVLNMHKSSAIVVIFIAFFSLVSFIIYKGFPVFFFELQDLSEQLPQLLTLYEQTIYSIYHSTSFLPEAVHEQIDSIIIDIELTLERYVERVMKRLINLFDDFVSFLMIPVLVFYMLKDFDKIRDYTYRFIPKQRKEIMERILIAIHEAFGTYIRGQMLLSLFIFTITFLLFLIIDLKYALVLSIFMGVMNVIPYFGPIIGTVPAIIIAFATSWQLVMYVIVIAFIVQIIESALLSPYIMGKTAKLHPIAIIFILLVSGELGGIVAMIIAIPSIMIIRAIILKVSAQKHQCIDN